MRTLGEIKEALGNYSYFTPQHSTCAVSHCSRGGVLGSDLNDSVESHSILEHNYRVRDSYVTDTG